MLLGIDFGTSNSCAAVMIDENLRLVKEPGKQGYSFPSSIYLDESGKILVGHFAESKKIKDSSRYRNEIKPDLIKEHPYILGQNGEYEFTAQQLITEILKSFKQEAEKITVALDKGEITDVVISIPATYRKNKRDAMIEAAKNAGFVSIQLIEEPVAAAIYYHQQNPATFRKGDIILIYDLGGGTFDATLIEKFDNGFRVISQPVGIENCGGINFDRAIFQDVKANFSQHLQEKLAARGNSPEKNSLLDFCRHIKHQFSGTNEAVGQIPIDHQLYELSRDDFNLMIDSSVEQTIVCCENLIKSAGLELQNISKILMVGGSCRIPYIQESIKNRLQSSVVSIDEPELAVCQGAAIYNDNIALYSVNLSKSNYSNKKNNEIIGGKTSMQNKSTTLNLETTEIRPWFAKQLDELAQIIALSEEQGTEKGASGALALSTFIKDLNKESNKLKNGKFRFLIIGDFNRGKSTILNAFFEQELLPMGATPTTAIPTFVKYASQNKVLVHKKNGSTETLSYEAYKQKYTLNSREVKSQIKRLYDSTVGKWLNDLDYAEFYYPISEKLREVEFIDTAGLNHTEEENRKTFSYIEQCHAILFVLAADQQFTQQEQDYLKRLFGIKQAIENQEYQPQNTSSITSNKKNKRPIFYLVNKWELVDDSSKEEIHDYFVDCFSECLNIDLDKVEDMWGNTIFDVYSKTALENLRQGKSIQGTGLKEFQTRLYDFLINERLLAELSQAVKVAEYVNVEIFSKVQDRLLVLEDSVENLEKKIEQTKPCIRMMQKIVQGLQKDVARDKSICINKIGEEYYKFFSELARNFEKEFEMPSVSGLRDNQREEYKNNLERKLVEYQALKLNLWHKISKGILSETINSLQSSFDQEIAEYQETRDKIREILSSGNFNVQNKAGLSTEQNSFSEDASISTTKASATGKMILGATGGTVGTVAAGVGGVVLANLAGANIVLGTIGAGLALTPVGWAVLGVGTVAGGITAWWQRRGEIQKFQKDMLSKVKQQFEKLLESDRVSSLKEQVEHCFDPFEDIAKQLDEDTTSLEQSLDNLLESKKTTEVNYELEAQRLYSLRDGMTQQFQIIESKYQEIENLAQ